MRNKLLNNITSVHTILSIVLQGPRSNFEIGGEGGGAPIVTQYWGGHKTPFPTNSL